MRGAAALLKLYDPEVVFETLRKNPKVRSLSPAWVAEVVQLEQERADAAAKVAAARPAVETGDTRVAPPRPKGRGGVRSKLGE